MPESRSLKLDLSALALLALTVFTALALASYSPADPPTTTTFPLNPQPFNLCGRAGAYAAFYLLQFFGLGAYYSAISMSILATALLRRRAVTDGILRSIGWLASLFGLTTLSALVAPNWSFGPTIGPGGYLGATGRGLLDVHFASVGSFILSVSLVLGGLLLCTDYVLVKLAMKAISLPLAGITPVAVKAAAKSSRKKRSRSDLDSSDSEPQDSSAISVKIRGKATETDSTLADEEEDESDATDTPPATLPIHTAATTKSDTDEDESEGTDTAASLTEKLAGALRIRRPSKSEREAVMQELDKASQGGEPGDYELPGLDLLLPGEEIPFEDHEKEVRRQARILEKTFANFGFKVRVVEIETGPVIAQFEVELEAGLRLSKITSLADDLAIALRVPSVRIVAPIPGKNTVGIEVPNTDRHVVRLREVIEEGRAKTQKMRIPIFLGKDVAGKPMVVDLATLPHLLIAGRTGTGKSVCLNSIIVSMLMTRRPDEVRMLMIDPKMVELSTYKKLPHLMHPVVTDMRKAEAILAWAVEKMEERYALLARAGVRHISGYNQLGEEELMDRLQPEDDEERQAIPTNLPYIVIVADEMADLMMTAAKEVEQHIIRLAQKSRAVGIHLVLATQKPTVDVITGLIKSNLPARIAFQVASRTDSRVVLDEMGADKLLGNGDMLFLWPGTSQLLRGQGTYVSDDEINRIVDSVGTTQQDFVTELVQLKGAEPAAEGGKLPNRDELYESAVDVVIREGRGSVSLLQRTLGIGYGRAARLIDFMAEDGIVGQYNGSQAREVLISVEQWEAMSSSASESASSAPAPTPKPPRSKLPKPTPRTTTIEVHDEPELDEADDEIGEADDDVYESEDVDEYVDDAAATEYEDDDENAADETDSEPPFESSRPDRASATNKGAKSRRLNAESA